MKSICYIVPYFGKLPKNFQLWLNSCGTNNTVNWLIYTDDKTLYDYPKNVEVKYCTFDDMKEKIQKNFDFKIMLNRPWKLCDFRVAFGEIFKDDIKNYDFWGYCDMDVLWGDIRKFITDEILTQYVKIGFQGHSSLYKNEDFINELYKREFDDIISYREILSKEQGFCFDENIICNIYDKLNIPYYKETNFAHLSKYDYSFVLKYLPEEDFYKNKRQIFTWEDGNLYRYYIGKDKIVHREEFMYIHFFCRPMTYRVDNSNEYTKYVMYPDVLKPLDTEITNKYINKHGKNSIIKYYVKSIYINRHKLTIKKIFGNIRRMIAHKILKKY